MIVKDEEIGKLRTSLKRATDESGAKDETIQTFKEEIDQLKQSKDALEKSLEAEKAAALQEMSRGKAGALQALQAEADKSKAEMEERHKAQVEAARDEAQAQWEAKFQVL